jgi:AcrR family transcriptional regulator
MQNKIPTADPPRPAEPAGPPSRASLAVERALSRRRAAYAREVDRLIEAAFVRIRRTGDLEPRVSELVRSARLSNQAFYRHFPSKDALLVAVLDAGARMLASYLAHRMHAAQAPIERIRAWLEGILEQALDPEAAAATRPFALGRGRLAERFPAEVAASERELVALVRPALAAAVAAGELPGADPERDAESLYHLAMGWMQARLVEAAPADRADAQRLVAFALGGLARGAGARAAGA